MDNQEEYSIEINRGDDWSRSVVFTDYDGVAKNITGWTIYFTLKRKASDVDADAVYAKNFTPNDPTGGIGTVLLTHAETLPLLGVYVYDIKYKDNQDVVKKIIGGGFSVRQTITVRASE
jgi:hypothetical protein